MHCCMRTRLLSSTFHDALCMTLARSVSVSQAPIITSSQHTQMTASGSALPLPTGVFVVHALQPRARGADRSTQGSRRTLQCRWLLTYMQTAAARVYLRVCVNQWAHLPAPPPEFPQGAPGGPLAWTARASVGRRQLETRHARTHGTHEYGNHADMPIISPR